MRGVAVWLCCNVAQDSTTIAMAKLAQLSDVVKPTLLAALGLFSLVNFIRHMRRRSKPGEDVPYAAGWLPIFGHILAVREYMKDNQKLVLGRWGMDVQDKQKLDVFAAEGFGLTFMVVNDPDLAEELCSGDPLRFTKDMRNMPGRDLIGKLFGNGLFFVATEDPRWQIAHNILKTPFSIRGMKVMMPLMCDQADALVQTLKREVGYGRPTYIDAWVTKMAFETIAVCGLGTSFGCFNDDQTHPYLLAFNGAVEFLSQRSLQFCPSYLRPLLFRGWPQFDAACEYMRATLASSVWLKARLKKGCSSVFHRHTLQWKKDDRAIPMLIAHARVDDHVPSATDGSGDWLNGFSDFSDADAMDGAKHVAYECSKSVASAVGHPLKGPELVLRIWESTAGAISKEVDSGRNIFVPGLGTFGNSADGIIFAPLEEFVQTHGLDVSYFTTLIPEIPFRRPPTSPRRGRADAWWGEEFKPSRSAHWDRELAFEENEEEEKKEEEEEELSLAAQLELLPRVKHSVASVARLLEVTSDVAMVHRMGQQMATTAMVAVSFAPLGTFVSEQRCFRFHAQLSVFAPPAAERGADATLDAGEAGSLSRSAAWAMAVFSRTQAAPFVGMEDPGSPSERIASSFTGSASKLTWKPCQVPQRSLRWQPSFLEQPFLEARGGENYSKHFTDEIEVDSPLDLELREAQVSQAQFYETLFRYGYYFDTIPSSYLAPFSDRWTQNIQYRTVLSGEEFPELMEQMWEEVLHDYRQAIRKVIIEHVLKEEKAKKRTGIFFALKALPVVYQKDGKASPAGARKWRICDLMDLQAFCAAQKNKMKTVTSSPAVRTWLGEVVEVLKPYSPNCWPVTLLCTQVRGVVDRSIAAFLQFFGPQQMDAFLRVGLQAQGSEIELTTSLEEIEVSLVQVFKDFVVSLSDLSFTVDSNTVTLWSVTLEEAYVQEDCVMEELKTLRAVQQNISSKCAEEISLHMVSIQCSHINETLRSKAEEAIHILLDSILRHLLLRNDHLCNSFEMVVNQVVKKPTSEMELVDLEMYIEEFRNTGLNELLREFDSIREWLSFLFTCENQLMLGLLKEKHFQAIYDSAHWVGSIQERVFHGTNLKREREALESKFKEQRCLNVERNKFLEDLEGYNEQVDQLSECGNLRQVDEYLERIQEKRFGWEVRSPFEQLKRGDLVRCISMHPRTLAYNMEESMRSWLKGPMFHIDPTKVDFEVRFMRKEAELFLAGGGVVYPAEHVKNLDMLAMELEDEPESCRFGRKFESHGIAKEEKICAPAVVAGQLNNQAGQMQETHLKLLYALCNQCLQGRHWDLISGTLGALEIIVGTLERFGLEPDASFTLAKAIELDVGHFIEDLQDATVREEISDAASAEYQVELAADAMEDESLPERKGTTELKGLVAAEPWEERLDDWEEWLQSMSEILSTWGKLQQSWTSLEVLFSGRDIYKQLPADIQTFRKVDKYWRHLMSNLQSHPLARDVCKMPQLLENLSENQQQLQAIRIEIIRKRREQHTGDDHRRDLLDMMLHDKDPKTGQAMTEDMIVDNVLTFLFAGQDSTAAAMASCLCFLTAVPRCKAKLLQEIDDVVGTGQLKWEHLSQMPYLDWCIKETMRLVPPAVGFARQARGDQLLGKKWRIPDGMPVIVNAMGMHYSKALWGDDAYEFRPERWEHGAPHRFAFIPFAVGPRACTGREFTVVEQKITMVKLFQNFDFRRPAEVEPEAGYTTVKCADAKFPPFINMDVEFKMPIATGCPHSRAEAERGDWFSCASLGAALNHIERL
eukprot:s670_g31.t1